MRDLLEADAYTVVEVSEAVAARMHSSDMKYQDCDCDPNMGRMGHKDLMITLAPDTSSKVVVVVKTKAMEALKNNYFML